MNARKTEVYFRGRRAGTLSETERGFEFRYDPDYAAHGEPISLTLPLRLEPYESATLPSFFEGLLPEGWYLDIASTVLKIDPVDKFGLLCATCRDCVGAVSLGPGK